MKCVICKNEIADGDSVFPFPKLPETHKYSALHGMDHVDCLLKHPDYRDIGNELSIIFSSFYGEKSEYPIVVNQDRILVQNREPDECLMIYNFKDFVQFHIPYSQMAQINSLSVGGKLALGVNNLLELEVLNDGSLLLEQKKPFMRTAMPSLNLEGLSSLLFEMEKNQS